MNNTQIKFREFGSEITLRFDPKFLGSYKTFSRQKGLVKFQELFSIVKDNQCALDENTKLKYNEITNVDKFGDTNPISIEASTESEDPEITRVAKKAWRGDCIRAEEGDILVASVRPYLKKFVFIDKTNKNQVFTKAFLHFRNRTKLNPELLYGFIRSSFITGQFNDVSRMGKSYPVLKEQDLKYVYFPAMVYDKKLDRIVKEINEKRNEARILRGKIKTTQTIVNEALARFLHFNWKRYGALLDKTSYEVAMSLLDADRDLRFSAKFYNPKFEFIDNFLKSQKTVKLRDLLAIPSSLGVSPDFNDEGEAYYLGMSSIKSGEVDFDNSRKLKDEFYQNNKNRYSLKKFDILMARSGKGTIGKVAILLKESPNIFADFTIRIRPNHKLVNPLYLFYYLQSVFFQENVERYHKGLGNMINIFPSQIEQFKTIDLSLNEQDEMVVYIQKEIEENDKMKAGLQKLREEVDSIVDKFLK